MSAIREVLYTILRKTPGLVSILSLITASVAAWLMVGLVMAEIIARNLFSYSVPFAVEYATYMVPVVGVGGAAYCLSKDGHVRVDIVLGRLRDRPRQWLILLGLAVGIGIYSLLAILAFKLALRSIETGALAMYPTETPIGYPQLILGVSLSLFALQIVIEVFRKARLLLLSRRKMSLI